MLNYENQSVSSIIFVIVNWCASTTPTSSDPPKSFEGLDWYNYVPISEGSDKEFCRKASDSPEHAWNNPADWIREWKSLGHIPVWTEFGTGNLLTVGLSLSDWEKDLPPDMFFKSKEGCEQYLKFGKKQPIPDRYK